MRTFECEVTPLADGLPSVTLGDVEKAIADAAYHRMSDSTGNASTTTVCMLTLNNGHTVIGTSACVVAEKFDAEMGQKVAYKNAEEEVWKLLGYELRLKLGG